MPHKAGHNPKYIKQTIGSRKEKRKAKKQGQRKSEKGIKKSNLAKRVASNIEEKLFAIYVKRQKKKAEKKSSNTGYIKNLIKQGRKRNRR